jgi:hypothetical protein
MFRKYMRNAVLSNAVFRPGTGLVHGRRETA